MLQPRIIGSVVCYPHDDDNEHWKTRASNGISWMDKVYPNWFKLINTDFLDIEDPHYCVWGQLMPAGFNLLLKVVDAEFLVNHGFVGNEALPYWIKAVKERQIVGI